MPEIRSEARLGPPVEMPPERRPSERQDKRFRRTERILRETLLEMLQTRRIVDITTTELCRRADISRNTFYSHYTAVEHLYDDMENEFVRALMNACEITTDHEANVASLEHMLELIRENRDLANALAQGHVITNFFRKLNPLVRQKIRGVELAMGGKDVGSSQFEALFLYIFSGARAVIVRWVLYGMIEDPHSVAEMLIMSSEAVLAARLAF